MGYPKFLKEKKENQSYSCAREPGNFCCYANGGFVNTVNHLSIAGTIR